MRYVLLLIFFLGLATTNLARSGEEALPLGEEAPEEEPIWAGRGSLRMAEAWDGRDGLEHRLQLDWRRSGLGIRSAWEPGGEGLPRAGTAWKRGSWSLAAGRLGGRWGSGLLLGTRRRPGLGRIPSPAAELGTLLPSSSRSPVHSGVFLTLPVAFLRARLVQLVDCDRDTGGSGQVLGLDWNSWRLDALRTPLARAMALAWRHQGEAAGLELALALGRSPGEPLRSAALWRFRGAVSSLELGLESMVLGGPALAEPLVGGWLGAAQGREVHAYLAGEAGLLRWRLARRRREGIGLGEGKRRLESGLEIAGSWRGGRINARARQIETLEREDLDASPGFPRSVPLRALRQELSLGWQGPWLMRWVRRQGGGAEAGTLILLGGRPLPALECRLAIFETPAGEPAFLIFDGAALHRRVEALSGGGWRLALRTGIEGRVSCLKLGTSWTRRGGEADRLALWLEGRLAGG